MVEIIVLGVTFIATLAAGVLLAKVSLEQVGNAYREGYDKALQVNREVRYLFTARVTTLENRLQTSNWQEFATLQQVPAETEKVGWSEQVEADTEARGVYTPAQLEHLRQIIEQGSDLEGVEFPEDMEGTTIG